MRRSSARVAKLLLESAQRASCRRGGLPGQAGSPGLLAEALRSADRSQEPPPCAYAPARLLEGARPPHRHLHSSPAAASPFFAEGLRALRGVPAALDPFALVKEELESVSERLRRTILSGIPVLQRAAEYFFSVGAEGKRLRPTMLLLLASSLASSAGPGPELLSVDERPPAEHPPEERRRQQRVAEISEMIHVASLLHDDVIDDADMRRGLRALNAVFGNKVAILAGDFLLARASVSLAALRDSEVIQLLSQVIEDLVSGEVLQLTSAAQELLSLDVYVRKSFYKTASLMANSCKAVAVLGGQPAPVGQAAWDYGRHLGLAFQIVDDVLDWTGSAAALGKPALADVRAGLATAPALFASQQRPELAPLILRRFSRPGDVERAQELVQASDGIQRAKALAAEHAAKAAAAIASFPPAVTAHADLCREALVNITQRVLTRSK